MKLKKIEKVNGRNSKNTPKLSVSAKGNIYFSAKAVDQLLMNNIESFVLYQDEEENSKWYIHLCKDGYCNIKKKSKGDGSAQAYVGDIAEKIRSSYYHVSSKSLGFILKEPFSFEDKEYYPIDVIKETLIMDIPDPNGSIVKGKS